MATEPLTTGRGSLRGVMEWAVAARPLPGQVASGDQHLVVSRPEGAFVAVVDGLGHGQEAAHAASAAVDVLERAANEPLPRMVDLCDRALAGSRGVALSAAVLDSRSATIGWVGIGDVAALLLGRVDGTWRERARLSTGCGIVGNNAPSLRPASVPIVKGDVLVLATDGIRGEFAEWLPATSAEKLAAHILARHSRPTDDALVLVARLCCGA